MKQKERRKEVMAKCKNVVPSNKSSRKTRPALTPEARENQMISLAMDLVEERLINGSASSQETTHFLKLASSKERLEKEILKGQAELVQAKTEAMRSMKKSESLYSEAINAFKKYSGQCDEGDDDEYY